MKRVQGNGVFVVEQSLWTGATDRAFHTRFIHKQSISRIVASGSVLSNDVSIKRPLLTIDVCTSQTEQSRS